MRDSRQRCTHAASEEIISFQLSNVWHDDRLKKKKAMQESEKKKRAKEKTPQGRMLKTDCKANASAPLLRT
jgi:hypothetical protein